MTLNSTLPDQRQTLRALCRFVLSFSLRLQAAEPTQTLESTDIIIAAFFLFLLINAMSEDSTVEAE